MIWKRAGLFVGALALAALLAWLAGFDFDRRGTDVAFGVFWSLIFAVMMACVPMQR